MCQTCEQIKERMVTAQEEGSESAATDCVVELQRHMQASH